MNLIKYLAFAALVISAATGCTLITDFDDPGDAAVDGGTLYSIEQNLTNLVGVTIVAFTGEMQLQLASPLPQADDATLRQLITEGTINITAANEETLVSYNLTDGTFTESVSVAGDYNVTLNSTRDVISVVFFNEFNDTYVHIGGDYGTTITVNSNAHFVAETVYRDVTVTGP